VWVEDALKHIHEFEYFDRMPSAESLAGALAITLEQSAGLLSKLESSGLTHWSEGRYRLTKEGLNYARHVIRAHRLYEAHLAQETGLSEDRWHEAAERAEHDISDAELDAMAQRLGDPRYDPHGDPIPTPDGVMPPIGGVPLLGSPVGWEGRIVHVEDEPPNLYAEIVARGLAPGMRLRVLAADEDHIRINAEGREIDLSGPMALRVMAKDLDPDETFDERVTRLTMLKPGERAAIVGLSPACRGHERNRLLDLGVVPGSDIEVDMASPSGNPVAYVIRGASIALRTDQAERILIKPVEAAS
jgi:DtxR family Mn-dependent transcriptional regulator